MKNFSSFQQCWAAIQKDVRPGTTIPPWSAAGRAKTPFDVIKVAPGSIEVQPANGASRKVTRSDFEKVFNVWSQYKSGTLNRYQLGFTQNSVYVIGILHWVESQPGSPRTGSVLGLN